ncbi:unnamed protein product [Orchesella dallaii]|uniref:C2H2-type domain-containing protein n=1 Tax=Orchesella dallaii TaxID=48710 RepID=A0ABP1RR20_9HEXA
MSVKSKPKVCFICLQQNEIHNLSSSSSKSPNEEMGLKSGSGSLFSKLVSFVHNYLEVSSIETPLFQGGRDNKEGDADFENTGMNLTHFCELCEKTVVQVCKLWKELLEVEMDLSIRLEELGKLVKESKSNNPSAVRDDEAIKLLADGINMDLETTIEFRNDFLFKCLEKSASISTQLKKWGSSERQKIGEEAYIKEELESVSSEESEENLFYDVNVEVEDDDDDNYQEEKSCSSDTSSNASYSYVPSQPEECSAEMDIEQEDLTPPRRRSPRKAKPIRKTKTYISAGNLLACEENECRLHFKNIQELNSHLSTHSSTIYNCPQCARGFLQPEMLELHKLLHTPAVLGNFTCPHSSCSLQFKSAKHMQFHYNTKHGAGLGCFKCSKCKLNLASETLLKTHLKKHDKANDSSLPISEASHCLAAPPCSVCGLPFLRLQFLDEHRKTVHNLGVECPSCSTLLCNRSALYRHTLQQHQLIPVRYSCPHCEKDFRTKAYMNEHLVKAHPTLLKREGKHQCPHCEVKFHRGYLLDSHFSKCEKNPERKQKNTRQKMNSCHICGKRIRGSQWHFRHHLKTHSTRENMSEKKPFVCDICGMNFASISHMNRHAKRHVAGTELASNNIWKRKQLSSKVKLACGNIRGMQKRGHTFVCEFCGNFFARRNLLTRHMYSLHRVPKPVPIETFVCHICGKVSSSKGNLDKHQVVHTKERKYSCHICSSTFTVNGTLKLHLVKVHGKEKGNEFSESEGRPQLKWKCRFPSCTRNFGTEVELKDHVEAEHFGRSHEVNNSSVSFMCQLCGKVFANLQRLQRHNQVHTKEKPYKCPICEKSFSQPNAVKGHLMAIHGEGKEQEYFACTQQDCECKFKCLGYLHKHLRQIHGVYTGKPRKSTMLSNEKV